MPHTCIWWHIVVVVVRWFFHFARFILCEWTNCPIDSNRIFHSWFWVHSICSITWVTFDFFPYVFLRSFPLRMPLFLFLFLPCFILENDKSVGTSALQHVLMFYFLKQRKTRQPDHSSPCLSSYCYCLSCVFVAYYARCVRICLCVASTLFANCSWNNTINQCQIFACDKNHGFRLIVTARNMQHTALSAWRMKKPNYKKINICLREKERKRWNEKGSMHACVWVCVCSSLTGRFSISHNDRLLRFSSSLALCLTVASFIFLLFTRMIAHTLSIFTFKNCYPYCNSHRHVSS